MADSLQCPKALKTIQETKIPVEAVYLGSDALSQVVGLSRTPQALKPKLRRLYANINLHLFEIANLTGQRKEDIVIWIEGASNLADKLGKFDIDKEQLDQWIERPKLLLKPSWLKLHHDDYLFSMLVKIEVIARHRAGVAQTNNSQIRTSRTDEAFLQEQQVMYFFIIS